MENKHASEEWEVIVSDGEWAWENEDTTKKCVDEEDEESNNSEVIEGKLDSESTDSEEESE